MTNPIVEKVETWLWQVALKKVTISIVKVLVAFITSVKVTPILESVGVKIDPTVLAGGLTGLITGGLTALHDWLKLKFNISWL